MKIHNQFRIPLPPAQAWTVLNDVPRVAGCVPGAELVEQKDADTYMGTVAVRLGPVALSFRGTLTYKERNEAEYLVRADASGNEQRARGTARANVEFRLKPHGNGTEVDVNTDVQLAGSIAQYGRGTALIESTAQVLMEQFAKNLAAELSATEGANVGAVSEPAASAASALGQGGAPASPAPRPKAEKEISAVSLVVQGLLLAVRRWFANLFASSRRS